MNRNQILTVCTVLLLAALLGGLASYSTPPAFVYAAPGNLTPTVEPPTLTPTPTNTPTPTATPDVWDKSSIAVSAACVKGEPVFTIINHGSAMSGPSNYWLLNLLGGASDCAADTADIPPSGTFQLGEGESIEIPFLNAGEPPYRICVAQRPGHPGTNYASATAAESPDCVTAIDEVDEGTVGKVKHLFVPMIAR